MDAVLVPVDDRGRRPQDGRRHRSRPAIAFSVFMFLYVRYCKRTPQGKIDLGLAYMLVNAAGIALLNTWVTAPTTETLRRLSWITIVILDLLDDHAEHAEEDAGGVAGGGLDGPARRLDRPPARLPGAFAAQHARPLPAQLFVRRRRRRPGALSAAHGPAAARGRGSGQLSADGAARPRRHGRGLAGAAPAARPPRGHQAHTARSARRGQRRRSEAHDAPVRARGTGDRGAQLPAHHSAVRLRPDRTRARSTT